MAALKDRGNSVREVASPPRHCGVWSVGETARLFARELLWHFCHILAYATCHRGVSATEALPPLAEIVSDCTGPCDVGSSGSRPKRAFSVRMRRADCVMRACVIVPAVIAALIAAIIAAIE